MAGTSGRALVAALRRAGVSEASADNAVRAAYSSDASLYRAMPTAVVFPRAEDEVAATLELARARGIPITARGSGTSVAGNACGTGLVLDFRKHMGAILDIDPGARSARVQPGVVQAALQARAAPLGLRFGPDPSTHTRCTIGGMIGNDSCGARSLGYGRTSHNVEALRLLTGTGELLETWRAPEPGARGFDDGRAELDRLVAANLAMLRTELGTFGRQISGYALHHLLPENGVDLTRALVGTEGTFGLLTEATVRLVADPAHRQVVALGYPDMPAAADDVPALLAFSPTACEGLDSRLVDAVRALPGSRRVPELPPGAAWLLIEIAGEDPAEVRSRAGALAAAAGALGHRLVDDAGEAAALWRIREDGAGLAGRAPSGKPAWAGWEDAAVPPAELGGYLRGFEDLLAEFALTAMPYGHFGEGCVHVRLDFELGSEPGRDRFRAFLEAAAELVCRHGGSLSGEHGDGRARSELLRTQYSPTALGAFAAAKRIFDPAGLLNPGIVVDPAPIDGDLRQAAITGPARRTSLSLVYPGHGDDLTSALHACTGVGRCVAATQGAGTVMCPSYAATGEEKDSTRGRARVLQELAVGEVVGSWGDPAVHDALDLCLACKGCASDCPTGTDMASYKAEVLHQTYQGRVRPRSHYTLGRLPRWADLAARAPRLANALARSPLTRRAALFTAGVDRRRSVPAFARRSFRASAEPAAPADGAMPAVLFVDTFTDHFSPEIAVATQKVLAAAGYALEISAEEGCCGLTWISTGQLDQARARMARTVSLLAPAARAGIPIVGIEPSCTAALRHDAVQLLDSDDARAVAGAVRTLAEVLTQTPGWEPPDLSEVTAVAQPHCHQHAVSGWDADAALLSRAGATVRQVGGCCGLAGNFGVERGHYEVSVAVAGLQLLPAIEDLDADRGGDGVVLADGFSCRTQVDDLAGRRALHLAELLAGRLPG